MHVSLTHSVSPSRRTASGRERLAAVGSRGPGAHVSIAGHVPAAPPVFASSVARSGCPRTAVGASPVVDGFGCQSSTRWCSLSATASRSPSTATPAGDASVPAASPPPLPITNAASAPLASDASSYASTRALPRSAT